MASKRGLAAALVVATALLGGSAQAATAGTSGATAAHAPGLSASWSIGKASVDHSSLPNLAANANAIAIEHIKLENEGWER